MTRPDSPQTTLWRRADGSTALAQLEAALASVKPEELPVLLRKLAEAEAHVRLRLARIVTFGHTRTAGDPEPADLMTAAEAAALAKAKRAQVYAWANGRPGRLWAARLSRRCLRVKRAVGLPSARRTHPRFPTLMGDGVRGNRPGPEDREQEGVTS